MTRWQYIVALLLALTLGMHQLMMASPSHSQVMAIGVFTVSPSPSLSEPMPGGSNGNKDTELVLFPHPQTRF